MSALTLTESHSHDNTAGGYAEGFSRGTFVPGSSISSGGESLSAGSSGDIVSLQSFKAQSFKFTSFTHSGNYTIQPRYNYSTSKVQYYRTDTGAEVTGDLSSYTVGYEVQGPPVKI